MFEMLRGYISAIIRKPEYFLTEQFMYGHREILLQHLGFDPKTIFLGSMQHGWSRVYERVFSTSPSLKLPVNRCFKSYPKVVWSNSVKSQIQNQTGLRALAIKSPWALLVNEYNAAISQTRKLRQTPISGSILYFPSHSYPGFTLQHSVDSARKYLNELQGSSISTCLYWSDYLDPATRLKYADFSEVVCCGYRGSAATEIPWSTIGGRVTFLPTLLKLILNHELIVFDSVSTAFAAACSLGKSVVLREELNIHYSEGWGAIQSIKTNSRRDLKIEFNLEKEYLFNNVVDSRRYFQEAACLGFGFDIERKETRETLGGISSLSLQRGIDSFAKLSLD